ncbi:mucin-2-like [Cyprinus carpio]|uniref:Mucin-2-like n=1 Tax=Cyprinus carpio TaxID=7962 RepID=A0A9R0B902_CYPCA|nr:mucin-2-like [Cyprinus carpio]
MSKEADRQSVLRTTKVRTALKGDNSWIQRREQENLEKEEEQKPWITEVRAKRSNGVFEETSTVSSPTANEPQPRPDTDKPKTPTSGYLIRGVFTKTDSKPTSTSSTNGYAGINNFNKKPSESYKKIAPHTIRSSSEKTVQSEPTLSPDEMEKRTEAASTVLKASAPNRRSYVMSAAKKYGSTEKPDSPADISTSSFVAKRVDISDYDTTASVKSVPVQSVNSNTEPVVKEVQPAAPETKSAPKPTPETKPASETKTTIEPKPTIGSKPAPETKPVAETKPTTQTKITESNTSESKPVLENATQPKTASEFKSASQPKPAAETTTTAEPKPEPYTKTKKPITQTTTATDPKPTPEPKPVETKPTTQTTTVTEPKPVEAKPVTTEFKPAIETKTATETKTETKPTTQTTTATDPKLVAETKPKTQTTVASDPKPTSEIKPVETKPTTTTEPKPVETKTATETKSVETKTFTKTITSTDPKPTAEPKPVETKPTTTAEPKPAIETKTATETKTFTQTITKTDPKPTPEPKPVETKTATETKSVETKTFTQTITKTDPKPTPEPKPVETKTATETKSATQPKPAPESKSEPVPEKSLSDTLISFSTEPASSGQADPGVDLLSQDLLTDSSSVPQTKKTHKTLDLLADDLIPFSTATTSLDDEFDPIAASSEPTKSPHWYSPPKPDSRSMDTFNHFQHPVDLVADVPADVLVSLTEDDISFDPKRDWETNMETYKTSIKTVQSSVQEKLPESDSKKGFVFVKEYVNNSPLDGSSSDYVSSTTSNYNYSSPSYYSRREMTPCTYCGEMVGTDAKITIEHLNISCHPSCFKCGICSKPMGDLLYNMFLHRGTVHCESCYSNVL